MSEENTYTSNYHAPVMVKECLEGLNIHPDGVYVDVTFGGGGHSKAILDQLGPNGKLFAFDQDPEAWKNAINDDRFTLIKQNFQHIKQMLKFHNIERVNGILADLGVSSHQFDEAGRGFSIRFEGNLDMRMNTLSDLTADFVVNEYEEEALAKVLFLYGELRNSRPISRAIIAHRPIHTTKQLIDVISPYTVGKAPIFQARVFQAIRIEVNKEIEVLERFIQEATEALAPSGRFVVMSYHSLEDRPVKNWFKKGVLFGEAEKDFYGNVNKPLQEVNKKPITASKVEIELNPRASSAKLRVAEKI